MPKHYIGMAGLFGYLPNCCNAFDSAKDAAESLGLVHDLTRKQIKELADNRFLELDLSVHGNEYCEIDECNCDDPDSHNDR